MNNYHEDFLAGRRIWWCPGGDGHLAFCPQPTDHDGYNYCCTYYYEGVDRPSCCLFPVHTGVVIALILGAVVFCSVMLFLFCWFWPSCLLARHLMEQDGDEDEIENN